MTKEPDIRRRRSVRLRDYDYASAGAYFVTICTHGRACLFGDVLDGEMCLNGYGRIVLEEWLRTEVIRQEVALDVFQVMPNHVHGIVLFQPEGPAISYAAESGNVVGAHGRAPLRRAPRSLGSLIAGFKSSATRRINETRGAPGAPVWQRNYYEHVIRSEDELDRVRAYTQGNPGKWSEDVENPANL